MYMRIVREQQIPNVNVVIKIAQAVPDQPTYGNMITQYHLPTPSKVVNKTEATRQMAVFMYFTLYNMIMHKPISQEKPCLKSNTHHSEGLFQEESSPVVPR